MFWFLCSSFRFDGRLCVVVVVVVVLVVIIFIQCKNPFSALLSYLTEIIVVDAMATAWHRIPFAPSICLFERHTWTIFLCDFIFTSFCLSQFLYFFVSLLARHTQPSMRYACAAHNIFRNIHRRFKFMVIITA